MKKALVSPLEPRYGGQRIADVADVEFPVAPPFFWVDVPDNVQVDTHWWDGNAAQPVPGPVQRTQAELIAATRNKAKTLLLDILPLLDSMQVDALVTAASVTWQGLPTPLAEVIRQLKASLRAVTTIDLSAYNTVEEMEDAVQAAYYALALQAPASIRSAFSALVPK